VVVVDGRPHRSSSTVDDGVDETIRWRRMWSSRPLPASIHPNRIKGKFKPATIANHAVNGWPDAFDLDRSHAASRGRHRLSIIGPQSAETGGSVGRLFFAFL